MIIDV